MARRMTLIFTLVFVSIILVMETITYRIVEQHYEDQLRYSIQKSNDQIVNFLDRYVDGMNHLTRSMQDSRTLQEVLNSDGFGQDKVLYEVFVEFIHMLDIFGDLAKGDSSMRIGIYLPDSVRYATGSGYFYPESQLRARADYGAITLALSRNRSYYARTQERSVSYPYEDISCISLFQGIPGESETRPSYTIKVSIPEKRLTTALQNAAVTRGTLVCIIDGEGRYITSSNEERYPFLTQAVQARDVPDGDWSVVTVDNTSYYRLTRQLESNQWQLISLIPLTEYRGEMSFLFILFVSMIFLAVAAVAGASYVLSHHYTRRITLLTDQTKLIRDGRLTEAAYPVPKEGGDELDELARNFNYMSGRIRTLLMDQYRLGKSVMSAEIKALQAQINPHFLYNTLDLINWDAQDYGADDVAEIARDLGEFYRLSLNSGRSAITIGDELRHVEAYVRIENAHYNGAIRLNISVPEEIRRLACLNIILQPFVENAIMHGISENPEIRSCTIDIDAGQIAAADPEPSGADSVSSSSGILPASGRENRGDLLFTIRDDGPGMSAEQIAGLRMDDRRLPWEGSQGNGYGIRNINFRLQLCYGEKYGVSFESAPGCGTTVHILIPALTLEELERLL